MASHIDRRDFLRGFTALGMAGFLSGNNPDDKLRILNPKFEDKNSIADIVEGKSAVVGNLTLVLDWGVLEPGDGSLDLEMLDGFFRNKNGQRDFNIILGRFLPRLRLNLDYRDLSDTILKGGMEKGGINTTVCLETRFNASNLPGGDHLFVRWENEDLKYLSLNGHLLEPSICEWPRFSLIPQNLPFSP